MVKQITKFLGERPVDCPNCAGIMSTNFGPLHFLYKILFVAYGWGIPKDFSVSYVGGVDTLLQKGHISVSSLPNSFHSCGTHCGLLYHVFFFCLCSTLQYEQH